MKKLLSIFLVVIMTSILSIAVSASGEEITINVLSQINLTTSDNAVDGGLV